MYHVYQLSYNYSHLCGGRIMEERILHSCLHTLCRSSLAIPVLYGIIHALIDLTTVSSVFRASQGIHGFDILTPFVLIAGYDLLAFGLQAPLGAITDRHNLTRPGLVISLVLVILAAVSGQGGWVTLACAGLGNALFHLSAGARVLTLSAGRATHAGVFVAPGAVGLGLGTWLSRTPFPTWPLAILTGFALIVILYIHNREFDTRTPPVISQFRYLPHFPHGYRRVCILLIAGLLLSSIAIRSFVGLGGCWQCPKTEYLMTALPIAGFLGKLSGGILSDRLGWIETSIIALLISAPLIAYSGGSPWLSVPGLLIFQATMPVTLTAMYLLMPSRPATAFGLSCFALIGGAVITFFPSGKALFSADLFMFLIPVSAGCIFIALSMIGIPWYYRPGLSNPGRDDSDERSAGSGR